MLNSDTYSTDSGWPSSTSMRSVCVFENELSSAFLRNTELDNEVPWSLRAKHWYRPSCCSVGEREREDKELEMILI